MDSPDIWSLNTDGMRPGTWWWWFWLFFWENPQNPQKPRQFMVLWSTKNDPKIICNGLTVDNHSISTNPVKCDFGGTIGAWYYNGEKMIDEYILSKSPMTVQRSPTRMLSSNQPFKTVFSEPDDGVFKINIGDDFEFTAESLDDEFSRLSYTRGVFFKVFDYRMTRMSRLKLKVREKSGNRLKGTAYFQKVQVNAPIPPWHWGIFHFQDYSLTYYRPFIGSALLSKNPFKKDPLNINKGLKSTVRFHDHKKDRTYRFSNITVKTHPGKNNLPVFEVSCINRRDGKISFTVEPYAEAVWRFRKQIANRLFNSNLHYQEYPSKIVALELDTPDGSHVDIGDTGVGVGNAEDNAGFLI